jgi:hypothetical protein
MSFIHEESQTLAASRPTSDRQSQITQTTVTDKALNGLANLTPFSNIPRSDLSGVLSEMDSCSLASLCRSLHLDPSFPADCLRSFADRLDNSKYLLFLRLLNPVVLFEKFPSHRRVEPVDRSLIRCFDLGFWFRSDFESSVIAGPVLIGNSPYSESFSIKVAKRPNRRIVIQSVCDRAPGFPRSLTIWSGDTMLVSCQSLRCQRFVDITDWIACGRRMLIEFQAQIEEKLFYVVVRCVEKASFDSLLTSVLSRRLENGPNSSLCCPITGKLMRVPVRSMKCRHDQCVEFAELIREDECIVCPVCRETLRFDDLAVDYRLMQTLAAIAVRKRAAVLRQSDLAASGRHSDAGAS